MSVTQQIKDRLDIVSYIGEHVPDLKRQGRYHKACCPFHDEKTPSFVVNAETQSWRCFGACAEGGDIFTFAQKKHGWSFPEALRELGALAGVEVKKQSPQQKQHDEYLNKLRGLLETAAEYYHKHLLSDTPAAKKVLDYTMNQRGFTMDTIQEWGIGYAPDDWHMMEKTLRDIGYSEDDMLEVGVVGRSDKSGNLYDKFRNRLMIPIRDERGRVVGFGARALAADDNPKYLNSAQGVVFDKSGTLFGLDRAKRAIRDTGTAVIVEGYMDVIQAHQAGFQNVVAQMGTAMTEAQLGLIVPRYANKIIMALDADEAGQNATRRSLEVARKTLQDDVMGKLSVDMRVLQIDDAKDPDDVLRETPDKWQGYVDSAIPVADFVIDMETADLPQNATIQERQQVAQDILPILTASENNLYKQENIQRLAMRLRIPEDDLLAWAQELIRIEQAQAAKRKRYQQQREQREQQREQQSKRDASQQTQTDPSSDTSPYDDMPPPSFDGEHVAGSSEMPPPPDMSHYDEADIPHVDNEDDDFNVPEVRTPAQQPQPRLTSSYASRATEAYCLRMLLLKPTLLAHVNRKLRELAGTNQRLLTGPLSEFCADDFSQGDYRALADALQAALAQDDLEPLDYLQEELDESLIAEMMSLILDDVDHIHQVVNKRMEADYEKIWRKFERQILPGIDAQTDVVRRALRVREQRLEREQQEIRFLIEAANQARDHDAEKQYFAQTMPAMQALQRIQKELKQRNPSW